MSWIAGVDGCKAGWFVVFYNCSSGEYCWEICGAVNDIVEHHKSPSTIAIDVPIGLLEAARSGGRDCDIEARKRLKQPRASSVFSPPIRPILNCTSYEKANAVSVASSSAAIGISRQCYGIIPKIREVDQYISSERQGTIKEVHPELCFCEMAGGIPTRFAKKKRPGFEERVALIEGHDMGRPLSALYKFPRKLVQKDDVLDAIAACWTARRISEGKALRIPDSPGLDDRNLLMEMWL